MTTPYQFRFYQHRYGGIYTVLAPSSMNTVDQSMWVVYKHEWPFDANKVYHRPYSEWTDGRFKEISGAELTAVFAKDREEFQKEITAKKEASKRDK